jgi:hypothetical protein
MPDIVDVKPDEYENCVRLGTNHLDAIEPDVLQFNPMGFRPVNMQAKALITVMERQDTSGHAFAAAASNTVHGWAKSRGYNVKVRPRFDGKGDVITFARTGVSPCP